MTAREWQELTKVGPGTLMGDFFRQYWIPAAKSSEVAADGTPLRLMLLGEQLIAFRDSSGRLGVMDHRCPHRCASLFLGRNEQNGIRCVYHGWKFDVDGNCVDLPNMPNAEGAMKNIKAKTYKVIEQSGVIWVYMGAREQAPPLPALEAAHLPEGELEVLMIQRECNWLQCFDGDMDFTHFGILHAGLADPNRESKDNVLVFQASRNRAPVFEIEKTPWGAMFASHSPHDDKTTFWRFYHFLFPFWAMVAEGDFEDLVLARGWVPIDDTHTMLTFLCWKHSLDKRAKLGPQLPGVKIGIDYLPNTTDWLGRFRIAQNATNDWLIDRTLQKTVSFTGIDNIIVQDQAVNESMGPIVDHEFEHLVVSDRPISLTRRAFLDAARAWRDSKTVPPGVDTPGVFRDARSGHLFADAKLNHKEVYEQNLAKAVRPKPGRQAAE